MKDETIYLLEHKEGNHWLTVSGELTNDPHDKGLLSYNDKFTAEEFLRPIRERFTTSFNGRVIIKSLGQDVRIAVQNSVKAKLEAKNIDLFKDFNVTEHLYV